MNKNPYAIEISIKVFQKQDAFTQITVYEETCKDIVDIAPSLIPLIKAQQKKQRNSIAERMVRKLKEKKAKEKVTAEQELAAEPDDSDVPF